MKPDIKFWNERARQPYCMTVINVHTKAYVIMPSELSIEMDRVRYNLFHQMKKSNEKNNH